MPAPQVLVIGGPNGAGKSTFAEGVLPTTVPIREFVNADVIAKGLSAFAPERVALSAGRIMLTRLRELAETGSTFGFETTMSTRSFAPFLSDLRRRGYEVNLVYVWLSSPDLAVQRVSVRVSKGGHFVPDSVVHRRYHRSARNFFQLYLPLADRVRVYDNSAIGSPVLLASKSAGGSIEVYHPKRWDLFRSEAERVEEAGSDEE